MENVNTQENQITIDTVLDLSGTIHILKILRNSLKYDIDNRDMDISIDITNNEETLLEITIRYSENIQSEGVTYMPDTTYDVDIKTNMKERELLKMLDRIIDEITENFYYCNENCYEEDVNECCKDKYIIEKLKEKGIKIE